MPLWLLGAFGTTKKIAASIPWQVWAGIAAIAALLLGVHLHSNAVGRALSAAKAQQYQSDLAALKSAQAKAEAAAEAQKRDTEARYAALAHQKDQEYATELAQARDALARYIATHRVSAPANPGGSGQASSTSSNHGSGIPSTVPADPFILVSQSDLQACTDATVYAVKAHDWALGLGKATSPHP